MSSSGINQKIEGNHNQQSVTQNFFHNIGNISSILANASPRISQIISESNELQNDVMPFEIEEKIDYNNIAGFKEIIDEYFQYEDQIDAIYDEYDSQSPGFRKKVLTYFRTKYLLKKQKLFENQKNPNEIDLIRSNSDSILNEIVSIFSDELRKSNNLKISNEEVDACSVAVVCHAFIKCKILEKPKK